ncbi:hypothetical protein [Rhizobacter sp. LjRoot28]|jgi:hypothetical protein|uniref:hypothetical protein n=1 Tax=Rhizobacter sp. LjRoot28 TaxID=3342309 RepID=UPI003ED075CB
MKSIPDTRKHQLARQAARGLGWFSIGLGLVELMAPARTARATGQRGRESLVRSYGMREIVTGVGLLTARNPTPWMWARVAGDALDAVTLASRADRSSAGRRAAWALAAVGTVAVADLASAMLSQRANAAGSASTSREVRDYSDRSGLPAPPDAMRGRALTDFFAPEDMRTPAALRPFPD